MTSMSVPRETYVPVSFDDLVDRAPNLCGGIVKHPEWTSPASASAGIGDTGAILPDELFLRYADRPAIIAPEGALTYGELHAAACRLATCLIRAGIAPNDVVGVFLPRSPLKIVVILALLRIGAAYLMLDMENSRSYMGVLAENADAILCNRSTFRDARDLKRRCLVAEDLLDDPDAGEAVDMPAFSPEATAYVMFTSGSTAKPRPVRIARRSLRIYLNSLGPLGYTMQDVCLHTASFSFSASVRQLFAPLSVGAAIVLATAKQARDPWSRLILLKRHSISIWDTTPSALTQMVAYLKTRSGMLFLRNQLKTILVTGEPLRWHVLSEMQTWFPTTSFVNLYSQTEMAGSVCAYRIPAGLPIAAHARGSDIVPAGTALPGNVIHLLDASLARVPDGETGDIHVETDRLAGTAEGESRGASRHRTGDCGYINAASELVVTGRRDFVVNIRGVRLSLEQVEATIAQNPRVARAAVIDIDEPDGGKSLLAYATSDAAGEELARLRAEIYLGLPSYMRPKKLFFLESLPHLPSNKIDRQRLRVMGLTGEPGLEERIASSVIEECDEAERQILEIVQSEFGVRLGLDEPIVNAGMDSLGAIRLAAIIEEKFRRRLTLTSIYEAATVRKLAAMTRPGMPDEWATSIRLHGTGSRTPIFFVPGQNGHPYSFLRLSTLLGEDQPFFGLQYSPEPMATFEAIAAYLLKHIQEIQPAGPYILAGHSLGGRVAFEIARQIEKKGDAMAALILLDSSAPLVNRRDRGSGEPQDPARLPQRFLRAYRSGQLLPRLWKRLLRVFLPPIPLAVISQEQLIAIKQADKIFHPGPLRAVVNLFKAELSAPPEKEDARIGSRLYGWERFAGGGVVVTEIPGGHNSCLREPHVEVLADRLKSLLKAVHTQIASEMDQGS